MAKLISGVLQMQMHLVVTPYVYGNGGQFLNDDQTKESLMKIRILRMLSVLYGSDIKV